MPPAPSCRVQDWGAELFGALKAAGGRAYSNYAVGYNNVVVPEATKVGIPVGNTPGGAPPCPCWCLPPSPLVSGHQEHACGCLQRMPAADSRQPTKSAGWACLGSVQQDRPRNGGCPPGSSAACVACALQL